MTDQPTQPAEVHVLDAQSRISFTPDVQCTNCGGSLGGLASLGMCAECGSSQPNATFAPIDHDCSCRDCGYALRGLLPTSVCPECSKPVWQSLRGDYLRYASAEYLSQLRSGLNWFLNGVLLLIAFPLATGVLLVLAARMFSSIWPGVRSVIFPLAFFIPWSCIAWGIWKFTTIDPTYEGGADPSGARKVLRTTLLCGVALIIISVIAEALHVPAWITTWVIGGLELAAFVTVVFSMLLYTKWLFARVPDQTSVRIAAIHIWLLPTLVLGSTAIVIAGATILPAVSCFGSVLLGLSWLGSLILFWNIHDRLRTSIKLIQKSQFVATTVVPTL